jgi:hypothetical protein
MNGWQALPVPHWTPFLPTVQQADFVFSMWCYSGARFDRCLYRQPGWVTFWLREKLEGVLWFFGEVPGSWLCERARGIFWFQKLRLLAPGPLPTSGKRTREQIAEKCAAAGTLSWPVNELYPLSSSTGPRRCCPRAREREGERGVSSTGPTYWTIKKCYSSQTKKLN